MSVPSHQAGDAPLHRSPSYFSQVWAEVCFLIFREEECLVSTEYTKIRADLAMLFEHPGVRGEEKRKRVCYLLM